MDGRERKENGTRQGGTRLIGRVLWKTPIQNSTLPTLSSISKTTSSPPPLSIRKRSPTHLVNKATLSHSIFSFQPSQVKVLIDAPIIVSRPCRTVENIRQAKTPPNTERGNGMRVVKEKWKRK